MSKKHINKGKRKTPEKQKMNVRLLPLALGALLMIAGVIGVMSGSDEQAEWSVSEDGILSYSQIGEAQYSISDVRTSEGEVAVRTVSFESRDSDIEGMMRIPSSDTSVPGVVVLPGAGISKEKQTAIPELLLEMGYASITIDQRNLGGIDMQSDMELFMIGKEPVEHMMVHDALMAARVLGDQSEVDGENIAMLGLSNGGRFAIIATALDPDIKGVVAISTSGYDTDSIIVNESINMEVEAYRFYRSIDPDTYLEKIAPRRFIMLHSLNDSIVPYDLALRTFSKAGEPKELYAINGSTHGYSQAMADDLQQELGTILKLSE